MYKNEKILEYRSEIKQRIRKTVRVGFILILIVFGGFGAWGYFAKVDKAAIASGQIITNGDNKVVQHLEGGIIEKILVTEGDKVKEGDVLISLSKTAVGASVQIVESSLANSYAEYYRLVAERDGLPKVSYPKEWLEPKVKEKYEQYVFAQNKIFEERTRAYKGKVEILQERTKQMSSEISGIRAQISSSNSQLEYVKREIVQVEKLLSQGNTTMTRLLSLRSRKAEIEGNIGQLRSTVSKTEQAISENKLNIINIKNENLNEVAQKIKEVQSQIDELSGKETATSDTLNRTEIRAPISGTVKDIKFKSAGGVVKAGEDILTIVPDTGDLIAEVRISPNDIDIVAPGKPARVRLSTYSARYVPMLNGTLTYVSPDIFKDERTQQNYYNGKITINIDEAKQYINKDVKQILFPGMPVEAFITAGSRSPLFYLIEPVTKTFRRSMRED
jgi:HlyD family type I secretion membrane fusion protein